MGSKNQIYISPAVSRVTDHGEVLEDKNLNGEVAFQREMACGFGGRNKTEPIELVPIITAASSYLKRPAAAYKRERSPSHEEGRDRIQEAIAPRRQHKDAETRAWRKAEPDRIHVKARTGPAAGGGDHVHVRLGASIRESFNQQHTNEGVMCQANDTNGKVIFPNGKAPA
jgi:hypothetical protein